MNMRSPWPMYALVGGLLFASSAPAASQTTQPKITPCTPSAVVGVWKMEALHENPRGEEARRFETTKERYVELGKDGAYAGVSGHERFGTLQALRAAALAASGADRWQYAIDAQGVMFLYKNRVVATSFYCGIASEEKGGYKVGDMVLTPTTTGVSKVFRHYRRITLS